MSLYFLQSTSMCILLSSIKHTGVCIHGRLVVVALNFSASSCDTSSTFYYVGTLPIIDLPDSFEFNKPCI